LKGPQPRLNLNLGNGLKTRFTDASHIPNEKHYFMVFSNDLAVIGEYSTSKELNRAISGLIRCQPLVQG
jgi:hypothetical protein